jgi:hypothetical protein
LFHPPPPGRQCPAWRQVPELAIDDFSDYEDDEHARRSSWTALDEHDWAKLTKGAGMKNGHWVNPGKGNQKKMG